MLAPRGDVLFHSALDIQAQGPAPLVLLCRRLLPLEVEGAPSGRGAIFNLTTLTRPLSAPPAPCGAIYSFDAAVLSAALTHSCTAHASTMLKPVSMVSALRD